MSLIFTPSPTALIVTGKTFHAKDELKKFGGKWSNGSWSLPLNADTPYNRAVMNSAAARGIVADKAEAARLRAYAKSPKGIAEATSAQLNYCRNMGWTCCDKAYLMDIDRGHIGCHEHGFFVKGILRTGD
jgi:hypothetical protein